MICLTITFSADALIFSPRTYRDHSPGLVAVRASDDAIPVGRQSAVVQEHGDAGLGRQQRADVSINTKYG